jgi:flagellar motor switch protein FliM
MGRPVHLLGRFTQQLREDLTELFHTRLNRRYRASFEIDGISLDAIAPARTTQKWLTFAAHGNRINVALDRNVLLCILGYRYGTHTTTPAAASVATNETDASSSEAGPAPETATEERLAARLARQLVEVVVRRVEGVTGAAARASATATVDTEAEQSSAVTEQAASPLEHAWTVQVKIAERTRQVEGIFWFRLEEAWITQLLRELAPSRERVRKSRVATTQPLPARLQLTLNARLLEKQMTLGMLMDLRIGAVVPITLGNADVLIGDSRLFTASVAEHKGKLCLTSFEPVE